MIPSLVVLDICIFFCVIEPKPVTTVVCPPVQTLTPEFQKSVAAALRARPTSALAEAARRWIADRDAARACKATEGKTK